MVSCSHPTELYLELGTGFSRRLVSDHGSAAVVHRHLARASYHAVSLSQLADHRVENPGMSDVPLREEAQDR